MHHHVEQVGDGRALVAADVGDAGLQQGLGDGEDALAVEGLALAQLEGLDLAVEGTLHCLVSVSRGSPALGGSGVGARM
jgi:hypothetical protein